MGCGYDMVCRTCRKAFYVGYGSYTTWVVEPTLREFERVIESCPDMLNLKKNQNVAQVLREHDGHDVLPVNWDYYDEHGAALVSQTGPMGSDEMVIPDFGEYERIDLYGDV